MKAIGLILIGAAVALSFFGVALGGCATTGEPPPDFDRCHSGRLMDACSVSDYPPLVDILPPWPFPKLLVPLPERTTP